MYCWVNSISDKIGVLHTTKANLKGNLESKLSILC